MTIYYTMIRGGQVGVWLTGGDVTFCVKEGRGNSMRVESGHPLDFTVAPGGFERICWSAMDDEPNPETEVLIELPPGTKVTITDLARYEIQGDDAALEVVDMRT